MRTRSLVCAATLALVATAARAETVLERRRLGNNTEGLTVVSDGRWRDHAVVIDGNDVIAIRLSGRVPPGVSRAPRPLPDAADGVVKLFDVTALPREGRTPRGIVHVPGQDRFYFSSMYPQAGTRLFAMDATGTPLPSLELTGLADAERWSAWEGMAYVPPDAPAHPNTIAALGCRDDFVSRLFFIRLDGTIEAEVVPEPGTVLEQYLCGLAYDSGSARLLVTACRTEVYAMGLDGRVLEGGAPVVTAPAGVDSLEGVAVARGGDVLVAAYEAGRLFAFGPGAERLRVAERPFRVGLGISAAQLAWDPARAEFVTTTRASKRVFSISPTLDRAQHLFDFPASYASAPSGLDVLPDGAIAIAARTFPRGVVILDRAGAVLSRIVFPCCEVEPDPFPPGAAFAPWSVAALGDDRLVLRVAADATTLRVVTRAGVPDTRWFSEGAIPTRLSDIILSEPVGGPPKAFDAGQGLRFFTGTKIFDDTGALLHTIDRDALGRLGDVTGAAWLGGDRFAVIEMDTSTLVVFSVP